ncbi:MAG: GGDEF domain-containing protein [Gordonia sp. (in: high G+C Gram-positive bacteria)]
MYLDSATLWTAIGTVAIVIGALQVTQYRLQRDEISMLMWGSAKLIGAIGAVMLALRGHVPDLVSVTVGNALIVLAVSLNATGTLTFNGSRAPLPTILLPPAVMTAGYLLTPHIDQNLAMQTYLNGVCVVAVLSWSAIHAHRANRTQLLMWRRGLAIVQWLWVATMLVRMAASLVQPNATDPTGNSPAQTITALCLLTLVVTLGVVEMLASRERVARRLAEAALHDAATGVLNRAGLALRLDALRSRCRETSLILMDLDDFKAVNDRFGHPKGDEVLNGFVRIVESELRDGDSLARYGGDEFCALLPNTPAAEAAAIAERIRERFSVRPIVAASSARCTVSVGVTSLLLHDAAAFERAVVAVDAALYAAKAGGRNNVVAGPTAAPAPAPRT